MHFGPHGAGSRLGSDRREWRFIMLNDLAQLKFDAYRYGRVSRTTGLYRACSSINTKPNLIPNVQSASVLSCRGQYEPGYDRESIPLPSAYVDSINK